MEVILLGVGGHRVLLSLARALEGMEVKLVSVAFPRDFCENIFIIIIPEHRYSIEIYYLVQLNTQKLT